MSNSSRLFSVALILGALSTLAFGLANILSASLVLIGLVGFYKLQARQVGRLGLSGLIVIAIGLIGLAGTQIIGWLGLLTERLSFFVTLATGIFVVGCVLLGIASYNSDVFPRHTGTGLSVVAIFLPLIGPWLMAPYLVWVGYLLWSGKQIRI